MARQWSWVRDSTGVSMRFSSGEMIWLAGSQHSHIWPMPYDHMNGSKEDPIIQRIQRFGGGLKVSDYGRDGPSRLYPLHTKLRSTLQPPFFSLRAAA